MKPSPFPDTFLWGSATAANQIGEGFAAEAKGVSTWDTQVRTLKGSALGYREVIQTHGANL